MKIDGGRAINLRCEGRGSPTVLLESGWGAWSTAWWAVQPKVSAVTRVCSYDRAGYAFSDPGPLPRDGAAIARDLDRALTAANVSGPFIVVGHSAGGLYARVFAARRLREVAGLVFVDTTIERPPRVTGPDGLEGIRRRVRRCLDAAQSRPPDSAPEWVGCLPGPSGTPHDRELAHEPQYWRSQLSELDEIFGRTSEQASRTNAILRRIPAYVLTASQTAVGSSTYNLPGGATMWELLQQELASRFQPGFQTTILSGHLMFKDRPEAVNAAILEMVRAVRQGRPPPPLPPSELQPPATDPATTWSGGDGPR